MGNLSSKLELQSFSLKFEISSCIFLAKRPQISKKWSQNIPEPRVLRDCCPTNSLVL